MHKSYLKYAGGKSRILEELLETFPSEFNRFIEPFTGSGTVALNVDSEEKILNDFNLDVISCHRHCVDNPFLLIQELDKLYSEGRDAYYTFRDEFNQTKGQDTVRRSAIFIYMNKHGFNGMVRYNSSGEFNIPVGKSKTIHYPYEEIKTFGECLSKAVWKSEDFREIFKLAESGDLIYCDPPYVPKSASMSDIRYIKDGFSKEDQQDLAREAEEASKRGCTVILSNHDTEVVRFLYKEATRIIPIKAFRSITRNADERGLVDEVIAVYEPC